MLPYWPQKSLAIHVLRMIPIQKHRMYLWSVFNIHGTAFVRYILIRSLKAIRVGGDNHQMGLPWFHVMRQPYVALVLIKISLHICNHVESRLISNIIL